jgi:hypothetical protein
MTNKYIVGIYDIYRAWGGSLDEGGWYMSGILVRPSRTFPDESSAVGYMLRMNSLFVHRIMKQNAMLRDGTYKSKYQARVYKDTLPKFLNHEQRGDA